MTKITRLLIIFIALTQTSYAQLGISADLSPRAEYRHGYRRMPLENDKAAININQRSRLILDWRSENLITKFSFQDVRVWGQVPQKTPAPFMEIHEAWAELLFNSTLSLRIGRQELRYDNQRFLAINDWIPQGQKHDMALLKYEGDAGKLHFGSAFNQEWAAFGRNFGTNYGVNNYKYMNFLWYNRNITEDANLSLLAIADGFEEQKGLNHNPMHVRGTYSAMLKYNLDGISLMLNPALQNGKTRQGKDIAAWYIRAEAETRPLDGLRTIFGIEILSGNDPEDNEKFRAFDPTHGAGHANSGLMDYFTNYPVHTAGAGLTNPFIKNNIRINANTTASADLHLFFIQNDFLAYNVENDSFEKINKYLGTELDLLINYRFNEFTRIIGGFSMMFGSESMEIIKGGSSNEPAYYVYIMLRIRPKLM